MRWAATALFVIAIATDALDGHLARSRNLVTDLGKILDPIADKALTGAALVVLWVLGELPWWVTILILVREIGITVWRFAVLSKGRVVPASKGGKTKTVLQSVAIASRAGAVACAARPLDALGEHRLHGGGLRGDDPDRHAVPDRRPAHRPGMTAARALDLLRDRGWTLGVAESLTGGLLADAFVRVPGASSVVLLGGVVAYATPLKHAMLGVDAGLLERRARSIPRWRGRWPTGCAAPWRSTAGRPTSGCPPRGSPARTTRAGSRRAPSGSASRRVHGAIARGAALPGDRGRGAGGRGASSRSRCSSRRSRCAE